MKNEFSKGLVTLDASALTDVTGGRTWAEWGDQLRRNVNNTVKSAGETGTSLIKSADSAYRGKYLHAGAHLQDARDHAVDTYRNGAKTVTDALPR